MPAVMTGRRLSILTGSGEDMTSLQRLAALAVATGNQTASSVAIQLSLRLSMNVAYTGGADHATDGIEHGMPGGALL